MTKAEAADRTGGQAWLPAAGIRRAPSVEHFGKQCTTTLQGCACARSGRTAHALASAWIGPNVRILNLVLLATMAVVVLYFALRSFANAFGFTGML
jgi:hypothetical protein